MTRQDLKFDPVEETPRGRYSKEVLEFGDAFDNLTWRSEVNIREQNMTPRGRIFTCPRL